MTKPADAAPDETELSILRRRVKAQRRELRIANKSVQSWARVAELHCLRNVTGSHTGTRAQLQKEIDRLNVRLAAFESLAERAAEVNAAVKAGTGNLLGDLAALHQMRMKS